MDWSLIIFVIVVAFFGYRGYRKGLLKSLARLLSLAAGYLAAILYSRQLATFIEANVDLKGVAAFIAASLILFAVAALLVNLQFRLVEKFIGNDDQISRVSSGAGAMLGLLIGCAVAFVLVWTFAFVRDMSPEFDTASTEVDDQSGIEALANSIAGKAVDSAISLSDTKPEIARLSAALVKAPAKITQQAKRLGRSPELIELLNNPDNQAVLDRGNVDEIRSLPAFQRLTENPDLLALAATAGMLDRSTNKAAVDEQLATQIGDIWGRSQRIKNDSRVQEILNNPEFQQKIQSGNPIDLLGNAELLELLDIMFAEGEDRDASPGTGDSAPDEEGVTAEQNQPSVNNPPKNIYSWTDSSGRVHYSDVKHD